MIASKFAQENSFIEKCKEAGVKVTTRQAAKFLRGAGAVYKITVQKVNPEKVHIPQSAKFF